MSVTASGGSVRRSGEQSGLSHESIEVRVGSADEHLTVRREPPGRPGRPPSYRRGYTPREREILKLVAAGQSNAEIARALGISRRTVEKHVESIHAKAGTTSRARLVAYALSVTFPAAD